MAPGGGGHRGGGSVDNSVICIEAEGKNVDYIATHPIFELCTGAEQILGYSQNLAWWYQDYIREEGVNRANRGAYGKLERRVRSFWERIII